MMNASFSARLMDRMPAVRGALKEHASLAGLTWFRVGGPADILFRPEDSDDLAHFLAHRPLDAPMTIIGAGSNLLVRDGGVRGIVIHLGSGFSPVEVLEANRIRAGSGASDQAVADTALAAAIGGFEFLSGIPGTIGGALRMNAGAFGGEMKDVVIEVRALDPSGRLHTLSGAEMGFSYRHSDIPEDWFFIDALLQGKSDDSSAIQKRMADIKSARDKTQPVRGRTGGSTFANPEGAQAWKLIEDAGCRGLRIGDAMVSELHCNFLLNVGDAKASDIEALGEEVRRRVKEKTGYELRWEIRRIGETSDASEMGIK